MDAFTAIAEPTRRRILDHLRTDDSDVTTLTSLLGLTQPLVSKHLRALRDVGAVEVRVEGQRRIYHLAHDPLPDVLAWVAPYRQLWDTSLDRLVEILDEENPA